MNFRLKVILTVNSSWFQVYEPNINNLKSKWLKELAQQQVPTTAFIDGREICFLEYKFYYKILPAQYDCNPNEENSHSLKTRTASSKNRKMKFRLEIKRTVSSSWLWLCEPQINNLKSKWSREWGQGQVMGREIWFLK